MPATEESGMSALTGRKVGVIAGGGALPRIVVQACVEAGIGVFIVGFEGQTDPEIFEGRDYVLTRLGAAGQIIDVLRAHEVRDLVLIGAIRRPSFAELRPDMRTAQFFARVGLKAIGDDGLLRALRAELETEGFAVHGAQQFVSGLLASAGPVGKTRADKAEKADIRRGMAVAKALGAMDVGQAVVVQEGIVLGVEGAEGTDELIRRCAAYRRAGRGGVLVKACKPQQDRDLDLPSIGPETVVLCAETGLAGIAVEAGKSLLIGRDEVAGLANRYKIFVEAFDCKENDDAA